MMMLPLIFTPRHAAADGASAPALRDYYAKYFAERAIKFRVSMLRCATLYVSSPLRAIAITRHAFRQTLPR